MKKWYTVINNKIFLIVLLTFSLNLLAKAPVARIKSMSGNAFVLKNSRILEARVGMLIDDFSEVITEDAGKVSIVDYYDHYYHLSSSSHLKFRGRSVELIGGYLWVQTFSAKEGFSIVTANSNIEYIDGEAIVSFDPVKTKTQLISIRGNYKISNIHDRYAYVDVNEGNFSFINKSFQNGVPRKPTPIGYKSFLKIRSLFSFVKEMRAQSSIIAVKRQHYIDKNQRRSIASIQKEEYNDFEKSLRGINNNRSNKKYRGKVLVLRDQSIVEKRNRRVRLSKLYSQKISLLNKAKKKKFKISYKNKKSNVKIKIFTNYLRKRKRKRKIASLPVVNKRREIFKSYFEKKRQPASVSVSKKRSRIIARNTTVYDNENIFENSLVDQYKSQKRHSKEVNSLIDQLNSIKIDNNKNY